MDIDLARTFLAVMSAGSFSEAAQRLHVSQTTVTARIQSLETLLNCDLFVRNRSGARLTEQGERFAGYAATMLQTWERARQEVGQSSKAGKRLSLGAETSLWNPLLTRWILRLQQQVPAVTLQTMVQDCTELLRQLDRRLLDAAIVHRPSYHSSFVVEQILEEKLVLVEAPGNSKPDLFINWGAAFLDQYDAALPQPRQSAMIFDFGPLALQIMLQQGGNGYFRTRVVQPYLDEGQLRRVKGAPEFSYPVFLVYRAGPIEPELQLAFEELKRELAEDRGWQL
ncbi:MAG: LysR family transcriptional regulator [Gammaproteobacteria bacterium]|nr:MAG: LysR family transcriptional regulator [Gammaproteobacteria bacterium]